MMRLTLGMAAVGLITLGSFGCGGGEGSGDSGVPASIDMSKSYGNEVDMPGMSKKAATKAASEARKAAAAAPAKAAPADEPAPNP